MALEKMTQSWASTRPTTPEQTVLWAAMMTTAPNHMGVVTGRKIPDERAAHPDDLFYVLVFRSRADADSAVARIEHLLSDDRSRNYTLGKFKVFTPTDVHPTHGTLHVVYSPALRGEHAPVEAGNMVIIAGGGPL